MMFFKISCGELRRTIVKMSSRRRSINKYSHKATYWSALSLGCLFWIFVSGCSTTKYVPIESIHEVTKTDTLYINNVQYDSIYVNHDLLTDRSRDTILIKEVNTEYRYKLLRDTIYRTKIEIQRDSIPYEIKVVETREVRYIPPWIKTLAWIGGIAILLIVLSIVLKLTIR